MKKYFALLTILLAIGLAKAQQTGTKETSSKLKVTAYVKYDLKATKYRIKLMVREDTYADQYGKIATIDELKAAFFTSLEEKGIDTSKFVDNRMEYALSSYYDTGTILTYETVKKKDLETILMTKKPKNVTVFKAEMYCKSSKDHYKKIVTKGLEEADSKVRTLARQIGKSVDKLELVEDTYYDRSEWFYMTGETKQYYTITATYSIK
ncbi:hypothetical protein [Spongiivirga citrea]|uniref:DUF541 domain-containing protein n=1 Tax=Spongiivirga citrea TaxID=1481457 RepID=A0A6M0CDI8_9FLAO|nr:hypothetical protein [Spongiivirga citrea]NER15888.1 hypothetical protein [Spongiivirga citrea]